MIEVEHFKVSPGSVKVLLPYESDFGEAGLENRDVTTPRTDKHGSNQ